MSRVNDVNITVWREHTASIRRPKVQRVIKNEDLDEEQHDSDKNQIADLVRKLPKLDKLFQVHRKIGEGTFSSVYVASLRRQASLPEHERRLFAVKHLVPTAHPARVEHELRCLRDIGGQDNVIGVELCLRHYDTIVFVMPYIPHRKFSEYMGEMDTSALQKYMRALLRALRRVHSFGVIHRDVKPSNFLYDMDTNTYMLVDFGLAQRIAQAACTPPAPTPDARVLVERAPTAAAHPAPSLRLSAKRSRHEEEALLPPSKRLVLALGAGGGVSLRTRPSSIPTVLSNPKKSTDSGGVALCACAGQSGVCGACAGRAAARAPRAGTQGFRPPEVLLKYPHQSTAVDMWACGVIMLSVLSGRYPFFRAADDASAAAEVISLLGTEAMSRAARALGRRLVTSAPRRGLCLRRLCARLRSPPAPPPPLPAPACRHCALPQPECVCRDDRRQADRIEEGERWAGYPDAAFALAARLLDPDPRTRISAEDALAHPFLTLDFDDASPT